MTEEEPTVVDATRHTFEQRLAAFQQADADLQAATQRREAARLAVMRSRPSGVTTLEVARRLRGAGASAPDATAGRVPATNAPALTERQRDTLRFVVDHVARCQAPPVIREIQEGLGISSTSVVARCLAALEAAGCIQRTARSSRSIVVLPAGHEALR